MLKDKVVYISGPISGAENFKEKFSHAAAWAKGKGARLVLNPAELPAGWDYGHYMAACLALVEQSDVVVALPGSGASLGARRELEHAKRRNVPTVSGPFEDDPALPFGIFAAPR